MKNLRKELTQKKDHLTEELTKVNRALELLDAAEGEDSRIIEFHELIQEIQPLTSFPPRPSQGFGLERLLSGNRM